MAFVFDPHDPNGQGMFSKAGRVTSAKYIVLQRQAEIMEAQRKFTRTSSLPFLPSEAEAIDNTSRQLQEEGLNKPKHSPIVRKKVHISPFSKQLSREDVHKIKEGKRVAPAAGFYNPKYSFVNKSNSILFNYDKEKPRPLSSSKIRIKVDEEELNKPLPDKIRKKIIGIGLFKDQIPRERYFKPENDPHEERFTYLDFPVSFSKTKKVPYFNMRKTTGRDSRSSIHDISGIPDYDPNHEFVKKQLGSSGPEFNKRTARKSLASISCCTNDSFFTGNQSIVLKYPRQKEKDFIKDIPRDWDPQNPLPCFMQKGNNSRLSIEYLNQKALEINNFSDSKFQEINSSFSFVNNQSENRKSVWRI